MKNEDEDELTKRLQETTLRLIAEAEYDYHLLFDPSHQLNDSADNIEAFVQNKLSGNDKVFSGDLLSIVKKMRESPLVIDENYQNSFLHDRIEELEKSVKYETEESVAPTLESIPDCKLRPIMIEKNENGSLIQNENDLKNYLAS